MIFYLIHLFYKISRHKITMTDCDCMICDRCDGHGYVFVGAPHGDDGDIPWGDDLAGTEEDCSRCDGTGIDPDYMGCDC